MVTTRHRAALLGLLALAVAALLWARREGPAAAAPAAPGAPAVEPVPRIALARIDRPRAQPVVGRRNVFAFGPAPQEVLEEEEAGDAGESEAPPPAVVEAAPPPPPPIKLKYIGTVEDRRGLRVAVLLTETEEILSGQAGEVVGQRYRIVKIGLESVDVQDVLSDRVQRIPLRAR